jgi:hypothetical protein
VVPATEEVEGLQSEASPKLAWDLIWKTKHTKNKRTAARVIVKWVTYTLISYLDIATFITTLKFWDLLDLLQTLQFKMLIKPGMVDQVCNPSFLGGKDQEYWGSSPAWAKSSQDPISTNGWVRLWAPFVSAIWGSKSREIMVQVGPGIKWDPISK